MKKLITMIIMAVVSSTAMADQIIFSQYDGVNTWNNVYVEVQNAKDFVKPGVGFAPQQGQVSSAGQKYQAGSPKISFLGFKWAGYSGQVEFTMVDYGDSYSLTKLSVHPITGVKSTPVESDESRAEFQLLIDSVTSGHNSYSNVSYKVIAEEVQEVKEAKPSWEQPLPARAIVSVPEGVDMNAFITEFIKTS